MTVWAQGFEAEGERYDSPRCTPGNKPCGKRCIPQNQNCDKTWLKSSATEGLQQGGKALLVAGALAGTYGVARELWRRRKGKAGTVSGPLVRRSGPGAAAPRPPAPYRGGKEAEYWSPNAMTNDQRRVSSLYGNALTEMQNMEARDRGLMALGPGRRTTPGSGKRRSPTWRRKS